MITNMIGFHKIWVLAIIAGIVPPNGEISAGFI